MSVVTEKIYPERFMHVPELARMGADIRTQGPSAIVHGVPRLDGAQVMASDIRGGAALLVAGLAAKGDDDRPPDLPRGPRLRARRGEAHGARRAPPADPGYRIGRASGEREEGGLGGTDGTAEDG